MNGTLPDLLSHVRIIHHIYGAELSVSTSGALSYPNASPTHPSTPSSTSSRSSNYGFHPYASSIPRGDSRSTSSMTNARSTSPAVSTVSVSTSVSSGPRSLPLPSSISTSSVQPTSKPKRRLTNNQRRDICLYFEEHPTLHQEDKRDWDVEHSMVSKILKHKIKWMLDEGVSGEC